MVEVALVISSIYYILVALYWLIQITKRYHFTRQRNTDFYNSVTYPCCPYFKQQPVEGVFKVVSSLTISIGLFSYGAAFKNDFLSSREIATVFMFFMVSGVMDILAKWSGRTFYQGLDYVALMLFFAMQSVVLITRSQFSPQPITVFYSLMLYTNLALLLTTALEMKFMDQVLCPVVRSYLLLISGTWGLQTAFLLEDKLELGNKDPEHLLLLAVYFSWHCGINFFIVLSIWLIIYKLMQQNSCCCNAADSAGDTVYLENRVHFDYHVLDRFESDLD